MGTKIRGSTPNRVEVWQRDGTYYGLDRGLAILVCDDDPATLIRKIEAERENLAENWQAAGLSAGDYETIAGGGNPMGRIVGLFAAKAAMITFAVSIVVVVAMAQFTGQVRDMAQSAVLSVSNPFQLLDAAAIHLDTRSEERQQETLKSIETIVRALKPYSSGLRPLFGESCDGGDRPASSRSESK